MNRLKFVLLTVAVVVAHASSPAHAGTLMRNELLALCLFPGQPVQRVTQCHAYIDGVQDGTMSGWAYAVSWGTGFQAFNGASGPDPVAALAGHPPYCLPENVQAQDMYRRVIAWMQVKEETSDEPAYMAISAALKAAFPCRK